MILSIKSAEYLCEITTGENRVGSRQRGREREKESKQIERQSIGQKWKWRGLEMAVSEKGHLCILSKANQ
jgi:hypothetical protein